MTRIALLPVGLVLVLLTGCAQAPQPTLLPLQIQSLQTREYQAGKDAVFQAVISVFQDLGYTITNADKDTGLISAESAAQSDRASQLWGYTDVSQTKATGFVETVGGVTRVRLNFVEVRTKSSTYGQQDRQDTPILDAVIYRNAFNKVESAIFLRS
ncbi:MAG: hypothetical protein OXB95_14255 [Rhodobacteraceae bacterium]|nr:hypothetical protein [Paracoccaceae bacterium]